MVAARSQPVTGHVPRALPVDAALVLTHFLSPSCLYPGPLLAVSWVCCLDALLCFCEHWVCMVPSLLGKLLLSALVTPVTSGDVICLF